MKCLFTVTLTIAAVMLAFGGGVCFGADISGTITYAGSRTDQVHVTVMQTIPGNKVLSLSGAGGVNISSLTSLAGSELTIQYWFRGRTIQLAVRQQGSGWVISRWNSLHILANDGGLNGIAPRAKQ